MLVAFFVHLLHPQLEKVVSEEFFASTTEKEKGKTYALCTEHITRVRFEGRRRWRQGGVWFGGGVDAKHFWPLVIIFRH